MPNNQNETTLSNVAILISNTLESYGIDGREFLREAGVDFDFAADPDTRIAFAQAQNLWRLAVERSGDDCFGLVAAQNLTATILHGLGFSWLDRNDTTSLPRVILTPFDGGNPESPVF